MAGIVATYIDNLNFSVVGDRSSEFHIGRRVQAICGVDGSKYGTIDLAVPSAGITTVTLDSHSDALTSNLTEVYYGIVRVGSTGSLGEHSHSGLPGSGGELINPIGNSNSVYTDDFHGDDVTGNGNAHNPYKSISAALNYITQYGNPGDTNRYDILVNPGVYYEPPMVFPEYVNLKGTLGLEQTILVPTDTDPNTVFITCSGSNWIDDFTFRCYATQAGICIQMAESFKVAYIDNVVFVNFKTGINCIGGSTLVTGINAIPVFGTSVDTLVKVSNGAYCFVKDGYLTVFSSIEKCFHVQDSGSLLQINNVGSFATAGCALHVIDGGEAAFLGLTVDNATIGYHVSGGAKITGGAPFCGQNTTTHVKIDDLSSEVTMQAGVLDRDRMVFPDGYTNEIMSSFTDVFMDSTAVLGDFTVGRVGRGSTSFFGEGKPYVSNMHILTTDNTTSPSGDGGNFINVTSIAEVDDSSTFSFQGSGSGYSILIGSSEIVDGLYKPFTAFSYKTVDAMASAIKKPTVIEYWNGSEWYERPSFCFDARNSYTYSNNPYIRPSADERIRFRTSPVAQSKTINGISGFFCRIRIVNDLTSIPTFSHMRIATSHGTFSELGFFTLEGRGLFAATERAQDRFGEVGGLGSGSTPVGQGGSPTGWSKQDFSVMDNPGDGIEFFLNLPSGICTACPIRIKVNYSVSPSGASTDAVIDVSFLPVEITGVPVACPSGGKVPVLRHAVDTETLTGKEAQTESINIDVSNSNKLLSFTTTGFDVNDYYAEDGAFIRIVMKTAGSVSTKDIAIHSVEVRGIEWSLGDPAPLHFL